MSTQFTSTHHLPPLEVLEGKIEANQQAMEQMVKEHGQGVRRHPILLREHELDSARRDFIALENTELFIEEAIRASTASLADLTIKKVLYGGVRGYSPCFGDKPVFYVEEYVWVVQARVKSEYFKIKKTRDRPWQFKTVERKMINRRRGIPMPERVVDSFMRFSRLQFGRAPFFCTSMGIPLPLPLAEYYQGFFERVRDGEFKFAQVARQDGSLKARSGAGGKHGHLAMRTWGQSFLKELLPCDKIEPGAIKGDGSSHMLFYMGNIVVVEPDVEERATYVLPVEVLPDILEGFVDKREVAKREDVMVFRHNTEESWKRRIREYFSC